MEKTTNTFDYKHFLKNVTTSPGVYQMINPQGEVLYVGKARNLQKRVSSYFRQTGLSVRIASLVSQIHNIEIIVTHTENEALLLESHLIKKFKTRYNILLRDDKSYPYIYLSEHVDYPRLEIYRGTKKGKGRYFGPYLNTTAVRETLNILQKLFRIRQCQDTFFQNRARPCLQYQIKRCTAPCVNYIDPKPYQENVKHAVLFLEGKNQAIIDDLVKEMETASQNMEFEKAARYRDQIAYLRQIQQQQAIVTEGGEVDVIAVAVQQGMACVQVLTIRGGRVLGSKSFYPSLPEASEAQEILTAFLPQYYFNEDAGREIPKQIIVSHALNEEEWLVTALAEQAKHKIFFTHRPHGDRARWLQMAVQNAEQSLASHLAGRSSINKRLQALQELLSLDQLPKHLECFDISHSQGEAIVASCVVFDEHGPRKSDYRRFNISNITPGDDYAAMLQALSRRYATIKTEEKKLPDILIIDGGKGQLAQAEKVFEELQIIGVTILAIAKGPTRKPGMELLFLSGRAIPLDVSADSLALHLLQHIRDEAHRFAITGHRGQRAKVRQQSVLESIPGIGAKRRRELLRQFGGMQELKKSSVEELAKLPGISKTLAEKIYAVLREI